MPDGYESKCTMEGMPEGVRAQLEAESARMLSVHDEQLQAERLERQLAALEQQLDEAKAEPLVPTTDSLLAELKKEASKHRHIPGRR